MRVPRIVDGHGATWTAVPVGGGRVLYRNNDTCLPREEIQETWPAARPVEPPPAGTIVHLLDTLHTVLDSNTSRQLLAGTLCVALDDASQAAGPNCPLTAGGTGPREALAVTTMAYVIGPTLAGDPTRFHPRALRCVTDVVLDWMTGQRHYTEVGETLASLIGGAVAQAGGWPAIADAELRASPYAELLSWYVTCRAVVPA